MFRIEVDIAAQIKIAVFEYDGIFFYEIMIKIIHNRVLMGDKRIYS